MYELTYGHMSIPMDRHDGHTDRCMDAQTEVQMHKHTDGHTAFHIPAFETLYT